MDTITPAQFEQARQAFVHAWIEVDEQERKTGWTSGARTAAGLTAALNYLKIKVEE